MDADNRLIEAQKNLEEIRQDIERIQEFDSWVKEAAHRLDSFIDYYSSHWMEDVDASSLDLEVTGEDAAYDSFIEFSQSLGTLARDLVVLVTREIDG